MRGELLCQASTFTAEGQDTDRGALGKEDVKRNSTTAERLFSYSRGSQGVSFLPQSFPPKLKKSHLTVPTRIPINQDSGASRIPQILWTLVPSLYRFLEVRGGLLREGKV